MAKKDEDDESSQHHFERAIIDAHYFLQRMRAEVDVLMRRLESHGISVDRETGAVSHTKRPEDPDKGAS